MPSFDVHTRRPSDEERALGTASPSYLRTLEAPDAGEARVLALREYGHLGRFYVERVPWHRGVEDRYARATAVAGPARAAA